MESKKKRGRKPAIEPEFIFQVLEKNKFELFENEKLKSNTHSIWTTISKQLNGVVTPLNLFISVYKDRHNFQTKLKKILNFTEQKSNLNNETSDEKSDDSNENISNKSYEEVTNNFFEFNDKSKTTIFRFSIPFEKYLEFKPSIIQYQNKNKIRDYCVLKPNKWSDIINDSFLAEYKLPCNFIYKRSKVSIDKSNSKYFLTFNAKCKECKCILFGWSVNEPKNGEQLVINIKTNDTRGSELDHKSKRPLKGEKRINIGEKLSKDLASNWRRENVADLEFGRISPPNLYGLSVLRKVKQQYKDKALNITEKCPFKSLIELKHNSQFSGSIHSIGIDPLFVHYWSAHQLVIYKDLCKSYSKISVDATGGLVKKVYRSSLNLSSSHIFLYEAVINTEYGQIPVTQMISEKQDGLTIFNWLSQWLRSGIQPPNEAICDFSFAILSAMSRAFCEGNSLSSYLAISFNILVGQEKQLPQCFIRIDVAHMMKIFCRLKSLCGIKNKHLKQFYVRGLRLLLTTSEIDEFKNILMSLLTIMLSETDGWLNDNIVSPAESCREHILNLIKGIKLDEGDELEFENDILNDEPVIENEETPSCIEDFLRNIESTSIFNSNKVGNRISAYYLPDLAKDVMRLCKYFPLWTGIMKYKYKSPFLIASSSAVESDFGELKRKILRFDCQPMSVDRFVSKHLISIDSNSKLFRSSQLRHESINDNTVTNCEVDEIIETSNPKTNFSDFSNKNIGVENTQILTSENSGSETSNIQTLGNLKIDFSDFNKDQIELGNVLVNDIQHDISDSSCSNTSQTSINAVENWRGRGNNSEIVLKIGKQKAKKRRITTYMQAAPEIDQILNRKTRSNLNTLLINGNVSTPLRKMRKKYIVNNTCPFDSIAFIISMAYIDHSQYRAFIDSNNNVLLNFCKTLAVNGTSKASYVSRLEILQSIFKEREGITQVKIIDSRCNVLFIVTKLLKTAPSAFNHITCTTNDQCFNSEKYVPSPTLILQMRDNFQDLNHAINAYIFSKELDCSNIKCSGKVISKNILQPHLFIETDVFTDIQQFLIREFPLELYVENERYIFYGVVAYVMDHYISYIRRSDGTWETHNDLQKKIKRCVEIGNKTVNPHCLVYIKL